MENRPDLASAKLSRRGLLVTASAFGAAVLAAPALGAIVNTDVSKLPPYGGRTLPAGVRPRMIPNVNGLTVNMLEAGTPGRPLVLLLHGFPNLAYSWRKVIPALAAAGYYAVAPDCRGYGRTLGWDDSFDADPTPFLVMNNVRDQIALVLALGYRKTAMIVGHDQGSSIANYSVIARPDMFPRLTLLGSGAGGGPASFPFNTVNGAPAPHPAYSEAELDAAYAKLNPPRKGYQDYWATKQADDDMKHVPQGMHNFFRAFYYMKSHDFPGNQNLKPLKPVHSAQDAAEQNAQMPEYYVMRRDRGMPATMAAFMPSAAYIANCKWFTEAECEVYASEYARTTWTGALHNYRHRNASFPPARAEQLTYSGRTIDVPAQIISGKQDWGANRTIGGPEKAGDSGFTQFKGVHMVDGGGHWVHEEQPELVSQHLLKFLHDAT